MKQSVLFRTALAAVFLAFISFGCSQEMGSTTAEVKPAEQPPAEKNVLKGPIEGRSNKAQTISITVGQETIMVRFDDATEGLDYAKKGEAAIIRFEERDGEKYATVIEPKLAKLPAGVTEIEVHELYKMLQDHVPMTLVDSRPEMRYDQAHLPGAINLPVPKLKELGADALPADKNKLLVFYCGGYT